MLVLLPPSETKRAGGKRKPLDLTRLSYPSLAPLREQVTEALIALSTDAETASRVLKLSTGQRGEIAVNAALRTAPTLPAVDRYTGVLYDALDAATLDTVGRRWLREHAVIQTAPWGPIGALDAIPAYRLGAAASVPGIPPLRRLWSAAVTSALEASPAPFILDLRSEAYVGLGPVPASVASAYVRVLAPGEDGVVRALNHFNKHAKGELVRALALSRPRVRSVAGFVQWANESGWDVRPDGNELHLVVR